LLRRLAIIFGIIVALLVGGAIYMGAFRTIVIQESEEGPFTFVYQETRSTDMRETGRVTTELHNYLNEAGAAGLPFDLFQPADSGKPNEVGFAVSEADLARLQERNKSFAVRVIPRQLYMKTVFPFRNRLSFVAGYLKVDPALTAYRRAHGFASTYAIARNDGATITYLQPVVQAAPAKN